MYIVDRLKLWWLVRVQSWEVQKLEDAWQACKDCVAALESAVIKRAPRNVRLEWAITYRTSEARALGLRKRCVDRQDRIDGLLLQLGAIDDTEFDRRGRELHHGRQQTYH